jgi:hypothetical protein
MMFIRVRIIFANKKPQWSYLLNLCRSNRIVSSFWRFQDDFSQKTYPRGWCFLPVRHLGNHTSLSWAYFSAMVADKLIYYKHYLPAEDRETSITNIKAAFSRITEDIKAII